MLKGWLLAAGLAGLWVLATIALIRAMRVQRKFACMSLLFVPVPPAFVALYRALPADLGFLPAAVAATPPTLGLINGLLALPLLYATLVMFFFLIFSTRSITLSMLCEFERAPARTLTTEQLARACGVHAGMASRLDALVANAYFTHDGDRYRLTTKGRVLALLLRACRAVFKMQGTPAPPRSQA